MKHLLYTYLALMIFYSPLAIKFWYKNILEGYGSYKPEARYDRILAAVISLPLHLAIIPFMIFTPFLYFNKGTTND